MHAPSLIRVALCLVLCCAAGSVTAQKQKVIFDCDLGGDIDDAYALALLLASPELEILGIVLDHGRTNDRAAVALKMLYENGLDHIPVYVGRETRLIVGEDSEEAPYSRQFYWARGFDRVKPQEQAAADFIIEALNAHPGEIILFTVGPVTNIGDVLKKDPDALKKAKRVVSMFGSFYKGYDETPIPSAEWNVRADVESAKLLAASGAAITYAGLDITDHVKLDEARRLKILMRQSPLTNALSGLYALWWGEWSVTPKLFDAVAVGMVLWPDLFATRPAHVTVIDGGYTVIDEGRPPNAQVGMTINAEAFLNRLMDRYLLQNLERP